MKLVCVHGWLGDAADFEVFALQLSKIRPTDEIRRHEIPGCGSRVREDVLELEDAARDLLRSTPEHSVAVGYSMGARVALVAAQIAPKHFAGLVLCGVHPGLATRAEREARQKLDARRAQALRDDPERFLDAWFAMPLFAKLTASEGFTELASRRRAHLSERANADAAARVLLACSLASQRVLTREAAEELPPTLLLHGSEDSKFAALAAHTAELTEQVQARALAGTSHATLCEAPEALAREVAAFSREIEATPA